MTISPGEGVGVNLPRVAGPPRVKGVPHAESALHRKSLVAGGAADSKSVEPVRLRPPLYSPAALPAPCRLCGGPTWLADDEGSIHPCCELSRGQGAVVDAEGLLSCPACKASEKLNQEQRRRHGDLRTR